MNHKVLVIEDDEYNRSLYGEILRQKACEVSYAMDEAEALSQFEMTKPDLILLDLRLGERECGLELFSKIRARDPSVEVIVISVVKGLDAKIQSLRHGAYDYIEKPVTREALSIILDRVFEKIDLLRELRRLQEEDKEYLSEGIITQSPKMIFVLQKAKKVSETDAIVLLTGETGTGKELLARYIWSKSQRKDKVFIPVNCSAIPKDLIESELFGHVKGAFTGATKDKMGILEEAEGGTVFLDEIGKMELGLQSKILRFLSEGEIKRVGDNKLIYPNVRVIAATNENLDKLVEEDKFLKDLYFRLAVVKIELPPLRERPEDIPLLARHFLEQYSRKHKKMIVGFDKGSMDFLLSQKWPGNVRELENFIESAVIFSSGRYITLKEFQREEEDNTVIEECNLEAHYRLSEIKCITAALKLANGEISRATRLVGLKDNRKKFYELLKKHQIDPSQFKR
ncbi:MAG: sigma-54-dependent transcriptional regulator [Thermodesulfobacteriota bacterium]